MTAYMNRLNRGGPLEPASQPGLLRRPRFRAGGFENGAH
jgi:hypothetical protein